MGSSTKSLTHQLSLTSDVNWGVNISAACTRDDCVLFVPWERACEWEVGEQLLGSCWVRPCCRAVRGWCAHEDVQNGSDSFPEFPAVLIGFLSIQPWNTNTAPVQWWWKGDTGHLVIMTPSFCLYCPCIISSIRSGIIDSPFMLMVWIWSVEEQILNHVVFRAWHLKWNEESVRFQSDIRMFLALASVTALSGATRLYFL